MAPSSPGRVSDTQACILGQTTALVVKNCLRSCRWVLFYPLIGFTLMCVAGKPIESLRGRLHECSFNEAVLRNASSLPDLGGHVCRPLPASLMEAADPTLLERSIHAPCAWEAKKVATFLVIMQPSTMAVAVQMDQKGCRRVLSSDTFCDMTVLLAMRLKPPALDNPGGRAVEDKDAEGNRPGSVPALQQPLLSPPANLPPPRGHQQQSGPPRRPSIRQLPPRQPSLCQVSLQTLVPVWSMA